MFYYRAVNDRINNAHKRATRIAYKDHKSDFGLLLEHNNSVTIQVRNLQLLMAETFKTKCDLNPAFMKDIFMDRSIS